ncbi:MAG: DedA family protein [Planctomycetota bacterium]|nr:MAG: DedA family protein [Planctomycetota bacterium]
MPDLVALGPAGLFCAAFLAGSVLPFPSEGVLCALLRRGFDPFLGVAVASAGNVLGALTLYGMGWGLQRGLLRGWLRRRLERDPGRLDAARRRLERWGLGGLLLAWVPGVGDAFVLGAGLAGSPIVPFLALVTVGKTARYALLAWTLGS